MSKTQIVKAKLGFQLVVAFPMEIEDADLESQPTFTSKERKQFSKELEESMKKQYGALCESAKITSFKIYKGTE